ncbi:MAG: FdtA/QdtA family cupin domain-containing protein [Acidobacteriota bacterium]|nr:FdtA/QdtA family cupin domain-containing protein [Acidobacteriota bacterium]
MNTVADCRLIKLPKIAMPQGNITPVEGASTIPFRIARVFYLYDIPVDAARGGHAHRQLEQAIVCVMGSFDMVVDDGTSRRVVTLRRADEALYVPTGIWGELVNFSSGAVCFTLASIAYEESDYLRTYEEFIEYRRSLADAAR